MLSESIRTYMSIMEEVEPESVNLQAKAVLENTIEVMKLYESNRQMDAYWKLWQEGPPPDSDMIRAIMLGRVSTAACEQQLALAHPAPEIGQSMHEKMKTDRMAFASGSYLADLRSLHFETNKAAYGKELAEEAIRNLRLVRQYCEWRAIPFEKEVFGTNLVEEDWKKSDYKDWNDYTGINPFIMELCPPHHIWRQYIYDGKVFYLDDKDELKSVPKADWDFEANKPKGS